MGKLVQPSLWARYSEEITGGAITFVEKEWGFMSFSTPHQFPDSVLGEDLYITPDQRDASHAYQLLHELEDRGRELGKSSLVFVINTRHTNTEWKMRLYLGLGFKIFSAENGIIWLKRPLSPIKE